MSVPEMLKREGTRKKSPAKCRHCSEFFDYSNPVTHKVDRVCVMGKGHPHYEYGGAECERQDALARDVLRRTVQKIEARAAAVAKAEEKRVKIEKQGRRSGQNKLFGGK